ncbi:MAG: AzlC family ABC transporter permease, partial [Alphaproteobacteria bacterium]|nr:AzlC family ABC transporter permease [Alphaproteobacteria bacterium]
KDSFGVPAVSIFASMAGFAALSREAGFDVTQAVATSALVWGMPGQVAMASLHLAGASALVIFTAVALANFRMLLMVVSGMDMMGLRDSSMGTLRKFLMMHMLAITSWVQLGHVQPLFTPSQLQRYFLAFGGMI